MITARYRTLARGPVPAGLIVVTFAVAVAPAREGQPPRDPFQRSFDGPVNTLAAITSGAGWADYDNDADLDLFLATFENEHNVLFENLGRGRFRRVDGGPLTADAGNSSGAAWADFDNDGFEDLAIANQQWQDNFVYRGLGSGRFERVVTSPVATDRGDSYGVSWADFDNDGGLDLHVTNMRGAQDFLYTNLGGGRFARSTGSIVENRPGSTFTATWGDYDGDGRIDLFAADPTPENPNRLYRNLGGGRFELVSAGPIATDVGLSRAGAWGDYDNDGDLDLYVTNGGFGAEQAQPAFFYRNDGTGAFTKITTGPLVTDPLSGLGAVWFDYDNDGDLDLAVAVYREHNRLYRNEGDGTFTRLTTGPLVSYGGYNDALAVADYNRDGALDLVVTHWEHQNPWLLTNVAMSNHWLSIKLIGTQSNRSAIGAKVFATATIGGRSVRQFRQVGSETGGRGQSAREVHFGLGSTEHIVELRVVWPSGAETLLRDVAVDGLLTIEETRGLVSSMPPAPAAPTDAILTIAAAFRQGGVDAVRRAVVNGRRDHPELDWAGDLSRIGRLRMETDAHDGRELLNVAIEEFPGSAVAWFIAAELRRAAGDSDAESLYCAALRASEAPSAAEDADARELEYIRLTSRRYTEGVDCEAAAPRRRM